MSDKPTKKTFPDEIAIREKRKLRAKGGNKGDLWFGLGMFGMVGWSVAIPTVVGIFLGIWIDLARPGQYSWTLMLLLIGLVVGCLNAWFWVNRQRNAINKDRKDDTE
jgi:ATP synthase protein I